MCVEHKNEVKKWDKTASKRAAKARDRVGVCRYFLLFSFHRARNRLSLHSFSNPSLAPLPLPPSFVVVLPPFCCFLFFSSTFSSTEKRRSKRIQRIKHFFSYFTYFSAAAQLQFGGNLWNISAIFQLNTTLTDFSTPFWRILICCGFLAITAQQRIKLTQKKEAKRRAWEIGKFVILCISRRF